jgi:hypothetical protein
MDPSLRWDDEPFCVFDPTRKEAIALGEFKGPLVLNQQARHQH